MGRLNGKVALITGAGHGQGEAAAALFASEGASVAVADIDGERAKTVADRISAQGGTAIGLAADVSDEASVGAMVDAALASFEALHILYNNAGILIPGTVEDVDPAAWHRQFSVNVGGPYLCTRAAIPHLRAQGGAIVNTASTAGVVGEAGMASYCATKGAIVNLTRAMALDYAREGVRVNCICPGWIDTGFNDPAIAMMGGPATVDPVIDTFVPMGRQGAADEIARLALFLASDESSLVTGAIFMAVGGLTAM